MASKFYKYLDTKDWIKTGIYMFLMLAVTFCVHKLNMKLI